MAYYRSGCASAEKNVLHTWTITIYERNNDIKGTIVFDGQALVDNISFCGHCGSGTKNGTFKEYGKEYHWTCTVNETHNINNIYAELIIDNDSIYNGKVSFHDSVGTKCGICEMQKE